MMGQSHAATGLLAGAATLPLAPVTGAAQTVAWVAAWGGFALLPDLDHGQSKAARLWGPLTRIPAEAVGALAGGRRQGTHDALVAPAVAAVAVTAALPSPPFAFLVFALTIGLALVAVDPLIPGDQKVAIPNLLVSSGGAWWLVASEASGWWLPVAAAGGVLLHIVGDSVTTKGVPVPLSWLPGRRAQSWGPRLFRTGSGFESVIVAIVWAGFAWTVYAAAAPTISAPELRVDVSNVPGMVTEWFDRLPEFQLPSTEIQLPKGQK